MDNVLITAICPHPPIIVPEVGRTETAKVQKTILALQDLSKQIMEASPDTIVLVTPHSYLNPHFFNVYMDNTLEGDLGRFGAPTAGVKLENDLEFIEKLDIHTKEFFNGLNKIPAGTSLDHGSIVPLYFIAQAGYSGKLVVINYTAFGPEEHVFFGELISKVAAELGRKIVFIASGDLSHKLLPTAPAGYDPDAHFFDESLADGIATGDYTSLINLNHTIRQKAGECGFNSLMVAIGVVNKRPLHNQILSYEAPFGVGYMVATL